MIAQANKWRLNIVHEPSQLRALSVKLWPSVAKTINNNGTVHHENHSLKQSRMKLKLFKEEMTKWDYILRIQSVIKEDNNITERRKAWIETL